MEFKTTMMKGRTWKSYNKGMELKTKNSVMEPENQSKSGSNWKSEEQKESPWNPENKGEKSKCHEKEDVTTC